MPPLSSQTLLATSLKRVWKAECGRMFFRDVATKQVYFIASEIGYIKAFLGVWMERANRSLHQVSGKG